MTQTVPLVANLGASKTGLAIGYRVLNLDRTEYSAFTLTDVVESGADGTYVVTGGVVVPDAGGYVVVGINGTDYAEADVDGVTDVVDTILKRDWNLVTGEAARSVLNALRFLRNRWTIGAGVLSVTKEDDSTVAWSAPVTTNASAAPVIGIDPS